MDVLEERIAGLEQQLALHGDTDVTSVLNQISQKLKEWIGATTVESQLLLDLLTCNIEDTTNEQNREVIVIIERLDNMANSLVQLENMYRDSLHIDTTTLRPIELDVSLSEIFHTCDMLIVRTIKLAKRLHLRWERFNSCIEDIAQKKKDD